VTEVLRLEGDVVTLQDIFVARPPNDAELAEVSVKRLLSPLTCTGLKPHFLDKLAAHGVVLPQTFFDLDDDQ
jgi:pilus assembly protein CpaF